MSTPAIDFKTICADLAARFTAANIGTPTGASAMRASYATIPKNTPATPCHLLEVQDGSIVPNPSAWKHEMNIDGLLLVDLRTADPGRIETQRQLWLPYLLHATEDALKIGLGAASGYTVDKALPTGWLWDLYEVGGQEYAAIRVHWTVYVTETVALVA
jgi:hypothetical protein